MNTTANWPLFAATAPIDSTIDFMRAQINFNKMLAQSHSLNDLSQEPNDLSLHLNNHSKPMSLPFSQIKANGANDGNNNRNSVRSGDAMNGEVLNLRIDESRDEDLDDDDEDSMGESIGDDDSLPSPDAMYATSYISNDSNERHVHNKDDIGSGDEHSVDGQSSIGPLEQLQNALERHPAFGNLADFSPINGTNHSMFGFGSNSMASIGTPFSVDSDITGELYRCHLCSYSGTSKCQFNAHMNTHFDHKCPFCDYTSRTEGRLKRHVRDFHSEVPPDSWAGNRVLNESNAQGDGDESLDGGDASVNGSGGNGKSRKYKCKQCEFVATCKQEFWDHSKEHIKSEKLLSCPKCNFVTEYKHHLEYHLRNHFGSKPFKCAKCNYSCVNKSMLNSHMKSHSNIYQYRCADCSYATKYCHSLKLHLRKYQHKPATVLNLDGTPNPYPVIDVYGTRRGPRPKKPKNSKSHECVQKSEPSDSPLPQTPIMPSPLSLNLLKSMPVPPLIPTSMSMGLPFMGLPLPMGLPSPTMNGYSPSPALLHSGWLGPLDLSSAKSISPSTQHLEHLLRQQSFGPQLLHPNINERHEDEAKDMSLHDSAPEAKDVPIGEFSPKAKHSPIEESETAPEAKDTPRDDTTTEAKDLSVSGCAAPEPKDRPPAPTEVLPNEQSRAQRRKGRASKLIVNTMSERDVNSDEDSRDEMCGKTSENSMASEPEVDNIIIKINSATNLLQEILRDMYSLRNDTTYH